MTRVFTAVVLALLLFALPYGFIMANPSIRDRLGMLSGRHDGSAQPPAMDRQMSAALAGDQPLNAAPYYLRAMEEERADRPESAEALVGKAAQLDPRMWQARLWLARRYLGTGRTRPAIDELASILKIRPRVTPIVADILGQAARDAGVRKEIGRRFANDPVLFPIVAGAAQAGLGPAELLEMLGASDLAAMPDGLKMAQAAGTGPLLRRGDHRQAHIFWTALLPGRSGAAIFDPNFTLPDVAPPFGWNVRSSGEVEAVSAPSGLREFPSALRVRTFSSLPSAIADQSLVLPAGTYRMTFRAAIEGPLQSEPAFRWVLRCAGRQLGDYPIGAAGPWQAFSWRFTIGADCPMQQLELHSAGTEGAASPTLVLTGLRLGRV